MKNFRSSIVREEFLEKFQIERMGNEFFSRKEQKMLKRKEKIRSEKEESDFKEFSELREQEINIRQIWNLVNMQLRVQLVCASQESDFKPFLIQFNNFLLKLNILQLLMEKVPFIKPPTSSNKKCETHFHEKQIEDDGVGQKPICQNINAGIRNLMSS